MANFLCSLRASACLRRIVVLCGVMVTHASGAAAQFLDTTFAPVVVTYAGQGAPPPGFFPLAEQPDGRLLITVGEYFRVNGQAAYPITRLNPNGTIDRTFVTAAANNVGLSAVASLIAAQPDGRIVAQGSWATFGGVAVSSLIRINSNGTLDSTFVPPADLRFARKIVIQPDNRVLLITQTAELIRLTSDGSLDPTFSSPLASVDDVALLPDGRIAAITFFPAQPTRSGLVRLLADGTIDPTFSPPPPSGTSNANYDVVAVQPDGKLLAGGRLLDGIHQGVERYNVDGSLDVSFQARITRGGQIAKVIAHPDGRVLVHAITMEEMNGVPVNRFVRLSSTGEVDQAFPRQADGVWLQADGRILLSGTTDGPGVRRYLPTVVQNPPPGPPTLSIQSASNPIQLAWMAGAGSAPAAYVLHAGSRSGASDVAVVPMGTATSISTSIPAGVRFYVRVVASNQHGSAVSNEVVVGVGVPDPPGPPTLVATQTAANPVTLSWAPGPGGSPLRYTIVAGTSPGAANLVTAAVGLQTSITAQAPVGQPLFVSVIAQNSAGAARSNEVSFTVAPPAAPPAPTLQAAVVVNRTVNLAWSAVNAASYSLVVRTAPSAAPLTVIAVGASTTISAANTPPGTYYVSVVARRGGLTSAESNQITVVVP